MTAANRNVINREWRIPETDSNSSYEKAVKKAPQKKRGKPQKWFELKSKDFRDELIKYRAKSYHEDKIKRNGEPEEMTNVTKERIIDSKFDFSNLSGCISDIRKKFWNIDRINNFYKKKIKSTHSHFYQKIVPGRTEEREEMFRQLKKGGFISALHLVDDDPEEKKLRELNKNNEVKFDSGSERDSYRPENDSVHWSDSDKGKSQLVDVDKSYNPMIIAKQADEISK